MTRQFDNDLNLPQIILLKRLKELDNNPAVSVSLYDFIADDGLIIKHYASVDSTLDDATLTGIFSQSLTVDEQNSITDFLNAASSFMNLPDWATWNAQQASDYVNSNILNGWTQAQVDNYINANVTSFPGTRAVLSNLSTTLINIRTILSAIAKGIIFLRDFTVRIRR